MELIMLNATMLSVAIKHYILGLIMLNVIMLNVVILSVVVPIFSL